MVDYATFALNERLSSEIGYGMLIDDLILPNPLSKGGVINAFRVNKSVEMFLPSFNLFLGLENLMLLLISNWNVDSIVSYLPIVEIVVIDSK